MEMKMTLLSAFLATCLAVSASAHDEGHGPKLSDTGKFGGLVSPVVKEAEAKLGTKAALVHKAELTRAADGTVRVYLYDKEMKPLDTKGFESKGEAKLAAKVKGKWKNTSFPLELKDGNFSGRMPKPEGKPYNIDVTFKESGTGLLSAFDNLD
jgi:hypothetical protein